MRIKVSLTVLAICMAVLFLGCGNSGGTTGSGGTKTEVNFFYKDVVGYQEWLTGAKAEYEKLYPDRVLNLKVINSNEGDYNTKTSLVLPTDNTIDAILVDSFLVASLVGSQALAPLPVTKWDDWNKQYSDSVKAGMTIGGNIYAVPFTTDTRGLYYNIPVFKKAGIALPWEPKTWADILAAVKKLHAAGVKFPIWMNSAKAQGEGTTMQTFEMLLGGTGDWLYQDGKWVVKSKGFLDALSFIQDIHAMKIYDTAEMGTMMDANSWQTLNKIFPEGVEVGIALDGSWKSGDWISALPDTHKDLIQIVPLPKKDGDGFSSMSGGWTLAVSNLSAHKTEAFDFIKVALNYNNMLGYMVRGGDMTVRKDVAAEPSYVDKNFYRAQMSSYVDFTKFRPGVEAYPSVSVEIQAAVESVITGKLTAQQAMDEYAKNVKTIVGAGNWVEK